MRRLQNSQKDLQRWNRKWEKWSQNERNGSILKGKMRKKRGEKGSPRGTISSEAWKKEKRRKEGKKSERRKWNFKRQGKSDETGSEVEGNGRPRKTQTDDKKRRNEKRQEGNTKE